LVLLSGSVPRLMDNAGYLLRLVGFPGGLPGEQLGVAGGQEGLEFVLVVKSG
jgi:hypothetical protein